MNTPRSHLFCHVSSIKLVLPEVDNIAYTLDHHGCCEGMTETEIRGEVLVFVLSFQHS